MKTFISVFVFTLFILTFIGCHAQNEQQEINDFPILKGSYLGQKPPGITPELFAPNIISSGSNDLDITIDRVHNEIYISRSGPDWFSRILCLKKNDNIWDGPTIVSFENMLEAIYPSFSPDGDKMYFDFDGDIYITIRSVNDWDIPKKLGWGINTDSRESFISISQNGNIYFTSNRKNSIGGMDIYCSEFINGEYLPAKNLGDSINTTFNEYHSCISPDESYIVFDSPRPGGYGGNDLYVSFKDNNGMWSKAMNMGKLINTDVSDMRPYITPDGKYLFFCSMRSIAIVSEKESNLTYDDFMKHIEGPGNGSQDIYWVSTKIIEELKPKNQK